MLVLRPGWRIQAQAGQAAPLAAWWAPERLWSSLAALHPVWLCPLPFLVILGQRPWAQKPPLGLRLPWGSPRAHALLQLPPHLHSRGQVASWLWSYHGPSQLQGGQKLSDAFILHQARFNSICTYLQQ